MKPTIKKILYDFIYSFISYALPTAVLQFIIQPIIARQLGSELNGQYLALMSFNHLLIGISAAVLNTVRMLQDDKYKKHRYVGDFNIFFCTYAILLGITLPIGYILYSKEISVIDILLYVLIGLLYLFADYVYVQYRLNLNFRKILLNNIILSVGYIVGVLLFQFIHKWQIIIICAYSFGGTYLFFNTTLIKEPLKKTPFFYDTFKKITVLTGSHSISSAVAYFDKLFLYPVLGGTAVSVYTTASVVGKILILISSPLNNVVLSYLVKMDEIGFRINKKVALVASIGLLGMYAGCVLVGYPLTNLLYPDWAKEAHLFIPITVAASLLHFIGNIFNTLIIRFYKASCQLLIQSSYLCIYITASLILMSKYSLMGFCMGNVIANSTRILLLIIIIKKTKKENEA